MTPKYCDHRSVGALIRSKNNEILLFQRGTLPSGYAGPAGHCDGEQWVTALKKEVNQELGGGTEEALNPRGFSVINYRLVAQFYDENPCRRPYECEPGHYWYFYEVEVEGLLLPSKRETKPETVRWYRPDEIEAFMYRTETRLVGTVSDEEWDNYPGLDLPWYHLFKETNILFLRKGIS